VEEEKLNHFCVQLFSFCFSCRIWEGHWNSPTLVGMQAPSLVDLVEHRSPHCLLRLLVSKHTIFWIISLLQRETWSIMWKSLGPSSHSFLFNCVFSFIQNSKWSCKCIYLLCAGLSTLFPCYMLITSSLLLLYNLSHIGKILWTIFLQKKFLQNKSHFVIDNWGKFLLWTHENMILTNGWCSKCKLVVIGG